MASLADKVTALGLFGMSWRIGFADFPAEHWDAAIFDLRQAWTLDPELTFYLFAPIVLRSRGLTLVLFVASAATRACFVNRYGFDNLWTYHFLPSTFLFFLLGHIAYRSSLRLVQLKSNAIGAGIGISALVASLIMTNVPTNADWDSTRFWFAIVLFAIALPGLFELTKSSRLLNFAGNLSFPVYLTHLAIIMRGQSIGVLGGSESSPEMRWALFVCALLVISTMMYLLIEQPFATFLRSPLRAVVAAHRLVRASFRRLKLAFET